MYVLGISCFYHDSAAALLKDGLVVAAVQEERLSRVKHDPSFPRRAVQWCLDAAGIQGTDLEMLAFHEKPLQKFDRILETTAAVAPRGLKRFHESMPSWFLNKLRVEDHLRDLTGSDAPRAFKWWSK
ncbi:MAG: carbamoyltransferase N-terminal domain-containing protein [Myxococcota bacterium]